MSLEAAPPGPRKIVSPHRGRTGVARDEPIEGRSCIRCVRVCGAPAVDYKLGMPAARLLTTVRPPNGTNKPQPCGGPSRQPVHRYGTDFAVTAPVHECPHTASGKEDGESRAFLARCAGRGTRYDYRETAHSAGVLLR